METRISNTGKEYVIDTADIQATAVPTNAGPDFHTNSWGKSYGIATMLGNSATPLSPGGGLLKINGHTDLTELMGKDKTKGYIQKVYLEYNVPPILYAIRITVYCAGPSGVGNSLQLMFQDLSYDAYSLTVESTSLLSRTVQYNSALPQLINFSWNTVA